MMRFIVRLIERLALLVLAAGVLVIVAVFVTMWLEKRPQFGVAENLHEGLTLSVDYVPRNFAAYVPGGIKPGDHPPLVMVLHPHIAGIREMVGKGLVPMPEAVWMDLAEKEKFILIYPEGRIARDGKLGWNDCRAASASNPVSNDTKFLSALIDYAQEKYAIDTDRVYVAGMSNGGFMALRMAQEKAGRIAAVAVAAALVPKKSECSSPPEKPVSVMFMQGMDDWILPPGGGEMFEGRGVLYSLEESIGRWMVWDGLKHVSPVDIDVNDYDPTDHSRALLRRISAGPGAVSIEAYYIAGQGHAAPSIRMKQPWWMDIVLGRQNHDIETAEIMWGFFKDKTRNATAPQNALGSAPESAIPKRMTMPLPDIP